MKIVISHGNHIINKLFKDLLRHSIMISTTRMLLSRTLLRQLQTSFKVSSRSSESCSRLSSSKIHHNYSSNTSYKRLVIAYNNNLNNSSGFNQIRCFATIKSDPPRPPPPPPPLNESNIKVDADDEKHKRTSNIDDILGLSKNVNYNDLNEGASKKTAKVGRLRQLWNQYGFAAIGTYFCLYWGTLGTLYTLIDNELISATMFGFESNEDCVRAACDSLKEISGSDLFESVKQSPFVGKVLMSLLATEFTEPLRIGATILIVPKVARLVKKEEPEPKT